MVLASPAVLLAMVAHRVPGRLVLMGPAARVSLRLPMRRAAQAATLMGALSQAERAAHRAPLAIPEHRIVAADRVVVVEVHLLAAQAMGALVVGREAAAVVAAAIVPAIRVARAAQA